MRTSLLLRWAWALLAALSVRSEDALYKKVGDDVVLLPRFLPSTVSSITWKEGSHIAAQWDGNDIDYYRHYEDHSVLNVTTAAFTIARLTPEHSANYSLFVNDDVDCGRVALVVIAGVPVPSVSHVCDDESCVLTCDADTSGATPVTYTWRSGETELPNGTSVELHITKESRFRVFTCDLKNPVSLERSAPLTNPLISVNQDGPKISVGLTVFISLLACSLLLVLFHRWKAGMWFYEKESFPWTADFWRKEEGEERRVDQSDGASPEEAEELSQPKL